MWGRSVTIRWPGAPYRGRHPGSPNAGSVRHPLTAASAGSEGPRPMPPGPPGPWLASTAGPRWPAQTQGGFHVHRRDFAARPHPRPALDDDEAAAVPGRPGAVRGRGRARGRAPATSTDACRWPADMRSHSHGAEKAAPAAKAEHADYQAVSHVGPRHAERRGAPPTTTTTTTTSTTTTDHDKHDDHDGPRHEHVDHVTTQPRGQLTNHYSPTTTSTSPTGATRTAIIGPTATSCSPGGFHAGEDNEYEGDFDVETSANQVFNSGDGSQVGRPRRQRRGRGVHASTPTPTAPACRSSETPRATSTTTTRTTVRVAGNGNTIDNSTESTRRSPTTTTSPSRRPTHDFTVGDVNVQNDSDGAIQDADRRRVGDDRRRGRHDRRLARGQRGRPEGRRRRLIVASVLTRPHAGPAPIRSTDRGRRPVRTGSELMECPAGRSGGDMRGSWPHRSNCSIRPPSWPATAAGRTCSGG